MDSSRFDAADLPLPATPFPPSTATAILESWGWKTSHAPNPSSSSSPSSPKRTVSRKRYFRLVDSTSDTDPPSVYYYLDDEESIDVKGRLLLDDTCKVSVSARNSLGGGKSKAVIVVRYSGRPTRKFAFDDSSVATSWVNTMNSLMSRYRTRCTQADSEDQFQYEIRSAMVQAAHESCVWSGAEDDDGSVGVPTAPVPVVAPPVPEKTGTMDADVDSEEDDDDDEEEEEESPFRPPAVPRDSIYTSDESETMRRLKMKWQTKLIEQKSNYGKLVAENRQIAREREELEGSLGKLLSEHEETIDDLERREQEIEALKVGNNAGDLPKFVTMGTGDGENNGISGEVTLLQLASAIKSGQISFVDPLNENLREHQQSMFERKIMNELDDAAAVILDSLGSYYRSAFRREIKKLPDESVYYEHGDNEDWDRPEIEGDISPRNVPDTNLAEPSSKVPDDRRTQRSGTIEVEGMSDEEDDITGGVKHYFPQSRQGGQAASKRHSSQLPDEEYFQYHEHEQRKMHRSGTIQVEGESDEEDDIMGRVMKRYNRGDERRLTYSKNPESNDTLEDLETPYEMDSDIESDVGGMHTSKRFQSYDKGMLLYYFYEVHNPTKIYLIPTILKDYAGEEDALFLSLASKYEHEMKIWDKIIDEIEADPEKAEIVRTKLQGLKNSIQAKANVQHSGWLEKKNRSGPRKYSKRFFKLLKQDPENKHHGSPILNYYTSEKTSKAKGTILLEGCVVAEKSLPPKMGSKAKPSFMFELRHAERGTRLLKTTTQGNLQAWMDRIKESIYHYEQDCAEQDRKDPKAKQRRRSSLNLASLSYKNESDDES